MEIVEYVYLVMFEFVFFSVIFSDCCHMYDMVLLFLRLNGTVFRSLELQDSAAAHPADNGLRICFISRLY